MKCNKHLILCIIMFLLCAIALVLLVISLPDAKFKFQVDSLEARFASVSSSNLDSTEAPSSSSSSSSESGLGLGLGLDVNVTLSATTDPKQPMVFDSLMVSLALDKSKSVLSSKTVEGFQRGSPGGQVKVEMKDVRIFPSREDYSDFEWSESLTFTVKVVGQYWPLSEEEDQNKMQVQNSYPFIPGQIWPPLVTEDDDDDDDTIDKRDLKITCKGIKIALPSSPNDVTIGGGSLPCSKTMYLN